MVPLWTYTLSRQTIFRCFPQVRSPFTLTEFPHSLLMLPSVANLSASLESSAKSTGEHTETSADLQERDLREAEQSVSGHTYLNKLGTISKVKGRRKNPYERNISIMRITWE